MRNQKFYFLTTLLVVFTLNHSTWATSSWEDSFYTDDSPYYLKLYRDGFAQRFKVDKPYCHLLAEARIILKSNPDKNFRFSRMNSDQLKKWPALYGMNNLNACWYQARVDSIKISDTDTAYLIKMAMVNATDPLYFTEYHDSILPKNRFRPWSVAQNRWITLGALGATLVEGGGVLFKIWEPTASRVDLFINESDLPHKMAPVVTNNFHAQKTHIKYVKNAKVDDSYFYKFVKNGVYENIEVANNQYFSQVKIDPMAQKITYENKGGIFNGYINPRAVIIDPLSRPVSAWGHDKKIAQMSPQDRDNWIIYQIWPATFNPKKLNTFRAGTFRSILDKIDYITDLGVTAVELLPIQQHRFLTSWGYALDSLIAIEDRLGTPEDLKHLVGVLHGRKIRVILDVVLNHINNHLMRDPLSPDNLYTKFYNGNTEWGPMPKFKDIMVRRQITDALMALKRNYHVDGFRYDMTGIIHGQNPNSAGYKYLSELTTLTKMDNPHFQNSAEELPDYYRISEPTSSGGMGFDSQWNDLFKNFFEQKFKDYREYNRHPNDFYYLDKAMQGYGIHQVNNQNVLFHLGPALRTVNYLGSHDFIGNADPFIRIISGYTNEEYDGNEHFPQVRPLEDPFNAHKAFRQIHNKFTHGVARLAYGVLFTKPGSILFFQGEEFANDINIQNEWQYLAANAKHLPTKNINIHRYIGSHRMPWGFSTPHQSSELNFLSWEEKELFVGQLKFFKEMIKFKKEHPGINYNHARNINTDYEKSIITYQINDGDQEFFIIANFGHIQKGHWINFPQGRRGNWWKEITNSSQKKFGGRTDRYRNIITNLGGRYNTVRLAPSSFMIFAAQDNPEISEPLYFRTSATNWELRYDRFKSTGDSKFFMEFYLKKGGAYSFKLATHDWEIALGGANPINHTLSYIPFGQNVEINLNSGHYRLTFDLLTFRYNFHKIE